MSEDDILHPGLLITLEEAAIVTNLPLATVSGLLTPIDDCVTLREALFVKVFAAETAKLPPAWRVQIAHTAATQAVAGGSRIFVIAWDDEDNASCSWASEVRSGLSRSVHLIPVERRFNEIAERLVTHRAAAGQRAN